MRFVYAACSACILLLSLNAGLTAAVDSNQTTVSQTYEGVHLSEALQKAKQGEGKLEDMLHWAIGQACKLHASHSYDCLYLGYLSIPILTCCRE